MPQPQYLTKASMMQRPSLEKANFAAKKARQIRAKWLTAIHLDVCTISDLISYACENKDAKPLLRITLVRLLSDQKNWNKTKAIHALEQIITLLDNPPMPENDILRIDVQWLLDSRSGGRRIKAFCDVTQRHEKEIPWTNFPFTKGAKT